MKKLFVFCIGIIASCVMAIPAKADISGYNYGFILSCGQTVYRTFDHELSDEELADWSDYYENRRCGNQSFHEDQP